MRSLCTPRTATLMLVLVSLAASGCDDGGVCEQLVNKLRGCGLLSPGEVECDDLVLETPLERCYMNCALGESCSEVQDFFCEMQLSLSLMSCARSCQERFARMCPDGSNTLDDDDLCDGYEDCDDGYDERDCTPFECADGSESIAQSERCDGYPDCDDRSDEQGCPGFACADGTMSVPEDWVCDGDTDCPDGSDEDGCPSFACTDGSMSVPEDWVCDGEDDCPDGSDEEGCPAQAELLCGD